MGSQDSSEEFNVKTCSNYIVEGECIRYTKKGYDFYRGLFAQAGISIKNVQSVTEHLDALGKCESFELAYAIEYGKSESADLEMRFLAAVTSENFEEADRLEAILDRKKGFKVVK